MQKGTRQSAGCPLEEQFPCQALAHPVRLHHTWHFLTRTASVSQLRSCHYFSRSVLLLLMASQSTNVPVLSACLCSVLLWASICRKEVAVAFLSLQLKAKNHKVKPDNLLLSQTFPSLPGTEVAGDEPTALNYNDSSCLFVKTCTHSLSVASLTKIH